MSIREHLIPKLIQLGKKHKWMKYPVLILVTGFFAWHYLMQRISRNKFRLSAVLCTFAIFFASNSFISSMEYDNHQTADVNSLETSGETIEDELLWKELPENFSAGIDTDVAENSVLLNSDEVAIYGENGEPIDAAFEDDWKLILVNKQNMVPDDYTFELGTIRGSIQADVRILNELNDMIDGAKKDGITLVVCSGCRDYRRQTTLFDKKIKNYMSNGMSYFEAYSIASQAVTIPGKSEHQIGLALDIISNTYTSLNEGFADTDAGKWLKAHSAEYGFILRYPLGKENITGIEFEPWHFRYVGKTAAQAITEQQITLEEYVEQIGLK